MRWRAKVLDVTAIVRETKMVAENIVVKIQWNSGDSKRNFFAWAELMTICLHTRNLKISFIEENFMHPWLKPQGTLFYLNILVRYCLVLKLWLTAFHSPVLICGQSTLIHYFNGWRFSITFVPGCHFSSRFHCQNDVKTKWSFENYFQWKY